MTKKKAELKKLSQDYKISNILSKPLLIKKLQLGIKNKVNLTPLYTRKRNTF